MALKKFKPTSHGRRFMTIAIKPETAKKEPEKSLLEPLKNKAARNNRGTITVRHQGGRNKRRYRIIDFKREKEEVPARVAAIEYDPNRSAYIALLHYADGEKRYILAPLGLNIGDTVVSGTGGDIRPGNAKKLKDIPTGVLVHNVEMKPGKGGQIARSAGAACQVVAKEGNYVHLHLPSQEVRLIHKDCRATIGQVGNLEHENISLGKAGRSRWLGRRPGVRGVVMNAKDHPHGGGEGKTPVGRESPMSPWGQKTTGYKTRRKAKHSDKYIVRSRHRSKKK